MITVVTPSVRPELLDIVKKCLSRQTFKDFEWIVVSPFVPYADNDEAINSQKRRAELQGYAVISQTLSGSSSIWIPDPPKKPGDNYGLNKAWNAAFNKASGELFVSIVDGLWFPPNTLESLWSHYQDNPKYCIGAIGHQYDQMENGKPEHKVWSDPRVRPVTFYQIPPLDLELCIASIPMQGIRDVGGVDEEFDKYAALSEKEMCFRLQQFGYSFWIDQSIEYRAIHHPRLTKDWDERYQKGIKYFNECIQEIKEGKRLTLSFVRSITDENEVSEQEPASQI